MPRKPVELRATIDRKAKSEASRRMSGKLAPLSATSDRKVFKKEKKKVVGTKNVTVYSKMITHAIVADSHRKGTTTQAICKYIESNYAVKDGYKRFVKNALLKMVEEKLLLKKSAVRFSLVKKPKKEKKAGSVTPKKESASKTKKGDASKTKKSGTTKTKKANTETKKETSKTKKAVPSKTKKAVASKKKDSKITAEKTRTATKGKLAKKTTTRGTAKSKGGVEGTASKGDLTWVWQYYDNGFYNYSPVASAVVEGVYTEYLNSPFSCDVRAVKSGQWEYMIDFREMTQQNTQHAAHTKRHIRRIQVPANEVNDGQKKYSGTPDEHKA